MSEMIERLARAMKQRAAEPVGNLESLEGVLVGSLGDAWPYLAAAALESMWGPTKAMLEAAVETGSVNNGLFHIRHYHIEPLWEAMIDAALTEKSEG